MKIGIEACTWTNRRGYGRFTRELVRALVRGYPEHQFVLVLDDVTAAQGEFPKGATLEVVRTSEQQIQAASAEGWRRPVDMWRLGRAVARGRFDVYFFPTRYSFYPVTSRTPTVVAFHDATAEQHPKLIFPSARARLFWRLKSRLALFQADRLVTVSQHARQQIAQAYRFPAEEISVISEGPDSIFRELDETQADPSVRERLGLPADAPLLLYVGGISPHKNLQGLFRALVDTPAPWHTALVGDYAGDSFRGCYEELRALAQELGLTERVTFTGYVPDQELVLLYNTATLLVMPSLSEGFGLPVVEAMACGLPVAASDCCSIPEILGDAGLLFEPTDPANIRAAMTRLLQEPELHRQLRARGLERAELFTWDQSARRLMTILEQAARARD